MNLQINSGFQLTALYGAILALIYVGLSFKVIRGRWKTKVGILDGGDSQLAKDIRVHANFSEYIPLILILLAFAEFHHYLSAIGVHIVGLIIVLSRIGHAYGLSKSKGTTKGRFLGAAMTFNVIIFLSLVILWHAIKAM